MNMRSSTTFKKGHKGFWLGKKMSKEHKLKMKISAKRGSQNYCWKGDDASYYAKHIFLQNYFGKANKCENKENKILKFECSNKSKIFQWAKKKESKYTRNKEDYYQLCGSCHKKYDITPEIIIRLKKQGIQKGESISPKTQFKKGQIPWNKKI